VTYTAKYAPGALTNSMFEAAESCAFKFFVLYVERAQLEERYTKILDAMSLGILVHELIEAYPQAPVFGQYVLALPVALAKLSDWQLTGDQQKFIADYHMALDLTQANGKAQGKVYTQPTWTTYWKNNYSHLDSQLADFNRQMQRPDWLCDIEPMAFVLRVIQAFQNYLDMRSAISAGLELRGIETTFHRPYHSRTLAGTIDRLDFDPARNGIVITDYKTGSQVYTREKLLNMNQMHFYAMALRMDNQPVVGFRVVSVERTEIVEVPFSLKAHYVFLNHRLPRLIHNINIIEGMPKELLPVLAGRSLALGCPCVLARLKETDPSRCPAYYTEPA
jgi:hypothetical protein